MKNKKIIIISSIALIIVVALLLGTLYFTTDLFKSNKDLFYKYIGQTQIINQDFVQTYLEAYGKIQKSDTASSMVINFLQKQTNETGINTENVVEIKSNSLKSVNKNQAYSDYTIATNNQQLGTVKFIKDGNLYAIGADNILVKYIGVENSNLKSFYTKLGIQEANELPNEFPNVDITKVFGIDFNTLSSLKTKYYNVLYNNIDKTHFSKIKNQDKTETISLSLTEQETVTIIQELLKVAKEDTELLNLIVDKAQTLGYDNINSEAIQNQIQKFIDDISNTTYTNEDNFIVLSLTKRNKIVEKIGLQVKDKEQVSEENDVLGYKTYKFEMDFSKAQNINIIAKVDEVEVSNIIIKYNYDENNIILDINAKYNNNNVEAKIQLNNYKTNNIIKNYNIQMVDENDKREYDVNIVNNINIKEDIQIEKLTTENFAKLNEMTEEELSALLTAITNRIIEVYGEQISNLGQ